VRTSSIETEDKSCRSYAGLVSEWFKFAKRLFVNEDSTLYVTKQTNKQRQRS